MNILFLTSCSQCTPSPRGPQTAAQCGRVIICSNSGSFSTTSLLHSIMSACVCVCVCVHVCVCACVCVCMCVRVRVHGTFHMVNTLDDRQSESQFIHRKNYPARQDVRDYRLGGPTETTTDFHGLGIERTSVVAHGYHCIL